MPYGLSLILILGIILIEFSWFSSSFGSNYGGVSIFLVSSSTMSGLTKTSSGCSNSELGVYSSIYKSNGLSVSLLCKFSEVIDDKDYSSDLGASAIFSISYFD